MNLSPKASEAREIIAGVVLLLLVLAGLYLLVLGLGGNRLAVTIAGCVIEAGYVGLGWLTGKPAWTEKLVRSAASRVKEWRERRATEAFRQTQAVKAERLTLAYLEERVDELVDLDVPRRLMQLEKAEEARTREEWSKLRDVWRVLILDPNTPEELRAACREWLAKYPETLDFLGQRLANRGVLREKDLVGDEEWERREQHKWRVQ